MDPSSSMPTEISALRQGLPYACSMDVTLMLHVCTSSQNA
jgi:hypothetical protein